MTTAPLVSIIIPCFNVTPTFAAALASARAQTYPNIEIVAIDDVSRDGTVAMLREYARQGLLTFVGLEKNVGCGGARNAGVKVARGEFLAFLDADDTWMPTKLEKQVAALLANPRATLAGCRMNARLLDGTEEIVSADRPPPSGPDAWRDLLRYSFYVPSTVVVPRWAFEAVGGYDLAAVMCEDQDLAIRLASIGDVECVDEVLGTMVQQATGLSVQYTAEKCEIVLAVILRQLARLSPRLTPAERRAILAARHAETGRRLMPVNAPRAFRHLARAVINGAPLMENLGFVVQALPVMTRLKRRFPAQWAWLRALGRAHDPS